MFKTFDFNNDVPKDILFVKLKKDISNTRKAFISNGIRSFFRNDQMRLYLRSEYLDSISVMQNAMTFLSATVGLIAITLAFYLLKVSTSHNISENVWEYGQLRAIGVTGKQGIKINLYEQYAVIISSIIIGICVGLVITCISAAQFLQFLDIPFILDIPYSLGSFMILLSLMITFYAVYVPIKKVNSIRLSVVLNG